MPVSLEEDPFGLLCLVVHPLGDVVLGLAMGTGSRDCAP